MTITLYNNSSELNSVSKVLAELTTTTAVLKDDTEISAPIVQLKSALPPTANYCYIPAFERYYYINKQNIIPGGINELSLQCDVLMSFKSTILDSTVIAERSTNHCNKSLPDNLPLLAKRNVIYKKLIGGIGESDFFGSDKTTGSSYSILLSVINSRGDTPEVVPTLSLNSSTTHDFQVGLIWNRVENATAYHVYRKVNDGEYTFFHTVNDSGTSGDIYLDFALETTGTFYFKVQVENNGAIGGFSNSVTYTYEG